MVAAVCSELGLYLTSTGKAVPFHTMSSRETRPTADANKDQLTINTEARDAITDLFPNIPSNDLHQIIKTAFQKVCPPELTRRNLKDREYLIAMMYRVSEK